MLRGAGVELDVESEVGDGSNNDDGEVYGKAEGETVVVGGDEAVK